VNVWLTLSPLTVVPSSKLQVTDSVSAGSASAGEAVNVTAWPVTAVEGVAEAPIVGGSGSNAPIEQGEPRGWPRWSNESAQLERAMNAGLPGSSRAGVPRSSKHVRQRPPARLAVAIDERREERYKRREETGADLNSVGVAARALSGRLKGERVVPRLD